MGTINNLSMEQYWEKRNTKEQWRHFTEENEEAFIQSLLVGWDDTIAGMKDCYVIDTSLGYQHLLAELGPVCGVPVVESLDYERIAQLNIERGKKYRACMTKTDIY